MDAGVLPRRHTAADISPFHIRATLLWTMDLQKIKKKGYSKLKGAAVVFGWFVCFLNQVPAVADSIFPLSEMVMLQLKPNQVFPLRGSEERLLHTQFSCHLHTSSYLVA